MYETPAFLPARVRHYSHHPLLPFINRNTRPNSPTLQKVSWVVPEILLTAAHSAALLGSLVALRFPLALRSSLAALFLLLWGRCGGRIRGLHAIT